MDLSLPEELIKHSAQKSAKTILWENILAIMKARWGKENFNRLGLLMGYKSGTMPKRIKNGSEDVQFKTVEKVAKALNLEPWMLLVPDLDPENPPVRCKKDLALLKWAKGLPRPPDPN